MASLPSLDELLEGVPPEKLDAPCKDVHLCQISLSITDWEVIAPFLRISRAEAEEINRDEGKTALQRIGMLRKWKEKCGRRATYRRLANRFIKVKRVDLVDEICRVLGDSDSSTDGDSPTPNVHQTILEQYADHLRHKYPNENPGFTQWPPPPTRKFFDLAMVDRAPIQVGSVREEYIRLTQAGNVDDIIRNSTKVLLKDIFSHPMSLPYNLKRRTIVLVEGAPGAGKSTLAWYICDQWGSRVLFDEFKLVVFVQLRSSEVQSAKSIADLLPRVTGGQEREVLSHLQTRYGRDVLFILDGWDEYSGGLSSSSICGKLIKSPAELKMQESTLLITSRPVASGELQEYCTTRIEIVGFTLNELKEYFKSALKAAHQGEQQAEVLQECLEVRPVIQASCYLPLNAAIVVHLFIIEGNSLPTTLHGLFTSLVLNCIVRHLEKTRQEEGKRTTKITSFETIPSELQPHFNAICALAYHGIVTNKASFSKEELHSLGLSTESSAPLLSLIQGWSTFKACWKELSYSFFHLSVQELLAAFHISKQPHEQQVEVFRKLFGQPRFAAVLTFYAAFTKLAVEGIRDFIKEVLQGSSGSSGARVKMRHQASSSKVQLPWEELRKMVLDCLFEAQDPELCQYVATVVEGKLTVDYTMSPFHCMVLGYFLYCLCLTPGGGKVHLELTHTDLEEYRCSYLINELKKCSHGLLSLSLFEGKGSFGVSVLIRMLQENCSHCISDLSLILQMNETTIKESLPNHSHAIPVVSLTIAAQRYGFKFDQFYNEIVCESESTIAFPHSSSSPPSACGLQFAEGLVVAMPVSWPLGRPSAGVTTAVGIQDAKPCDAVSHASRVVREVNAQPLKPVANFVEYSGRNTLKVLQLSGCIVCEGIAQVLAVCLNASSVLETLSISGSSFTLKGAKVLGHALVKVSTSKAISRSQHEPPVSTGPQLARGSAHHVASANSLFHCAHLKRLYLLDCTIPPQGAVALAAGPLARNVMLNTLILISGCNPPESAGILAVALAVRSNEAAWDLSGYTIPPEGMKILSDSLPSSLPLKTLNLSGCTIPPENATIVAEFLARSPNLKALISGCRPPDSAGILAVALAVRSNQETLDLPGHTIPPEGMKMLASSLSRNPFLKTLNFSDCTIPPDDAVLIADFLVSNPNVKASISGCGPPESAGMLTVALVVRSPQETWDLSGHTLRPEGLKMLSDTLPSNPSLKTLNFSGCTIPPKHATILADFLDFNSAIDTLNISKCRIPQGGVRVLVQSLSRNQVIKDLNLSRCKFSEGNMLALAEAVGSSETLETLRLPYTHIGYYGSGADCIITALTRNPPVHLKLLDVSWSRLGIQGTEALQYLLAANQTLEVLILSHNDLSTGYAQTTGAHFLAQGLWQNNSLKSLNLAFCELSVCTMRVILEAVEYHPSLQKLDVHGNLLPESEFQVLNQRVKISL